VFAATDEELLFKIRQTQKLTETSYFEVLLYVKISRRCSQRNVLDSSQVHMGFVVDKVGFGYVCLPLFQLSISTFIPPLPPGGISAI
jgi:hypothetical protein